MKKRKLKIGLVLDTSLDPTDGVQQYVIGVGEWLRKQGHDIHYVVGQTESRQLQNVHSLAKNISVRFNGNRTTIPLPTSRKKLRNFLRQEKFDILHIQVPHSPFMAQRLIMSADSNTAIVGTFHILPYDRLSRLGSHALGIWLRPSLKRFDIMLSVSPAAQKFSAESFKLDSKVLPNVIDYKLFNQAKPLAKYNDDKLTILFLGRLVPRKGCLLLLKAVALLIESGQKLPDFRVVVCGKGPLELKLREFVNFHKMNDLVEFTGFVSEEDKPRYYASADIAVFPSTSGESFGIVLLEAMAHGRAAVLAGDNPGYHSVMDPRPELLFDPYDPDILAQKLAIYMTNSKLRLSLGKWGADYTRGFDTDVVGAKLIKIYDQALRKRRGL